MIPLIEILGLLLAGALFPARGTLFGIELWEIRDTILCPVIAHFPVRVRKIFLGRIDPSESLIYSRPYTRIA